MSLKGEGKLASGPEGKSKKGAGVFRYKRLWLKNDSGLFISSYLFEVAKDRKLRY